MKRPEKEVVADLQKVIRAFANREEMTNRQVGVAALAMAITSAIRDDVPRENFIQMVEDGWAVTEMLQSIGLKV